MGNAVVKLTVDDKQYNASLKDARKGLTDLVQSLRVTGSSFDSVSRETMEYVQAIGKMDAASKTAKGKIGEMTNAFIELSQVERQLTEQERNSPIGVALTQSLAQLRQRTIEAKQELVDLGRQLEEVKVPDVGVGSLLSGLTDKLGGALQVFGGNMLTQAVNALQESVTQSTELARAAEGVEVAFERLNRPNLLGNLKEATHGTVSEFELMKAAVKFDDFKLPLEELGTLLAFAQQKAKDTGQSVDYMVDSIVTGLGRKSLMVLDNLGLSASEIKDRMGETGDMTKAVADIIRDRMAAAGGYVETAADRAARATAENQDAMRRLGKEIMPIANVATNAFSAIRTAVVDGIGVIVKYKEAILVTTAGVSGYTVAANASAIATSAYTAATKVATTVTQAFNAALKASPFGLLVGGLTAAAAAIVAFGDTSSRESQREQDERSVRIRQMQREQAERERLSQKAQDESNVISSAVTDRISRYKLLQTEWTRLSTIEQKNAFIKENASAFDALGVSINSTADAMKFFVENADNVIKAMEAMAKADAARDLLKDAYRKQLQYDPAKDTKYDSYALSTAEMRTLTPRNIVAGRALTAYQGQRDETIRKHIDDFINSNPELKAAGLTANDYKSNNTVGGQIEFHMNVTGLQKIQEIRKNNIIKQATDEINGDVERLQQAFDTATLEAQQLSAKNLKLGNPKMTGNPTTTPAPKTEEQQNTAAINALVEEYQKLATAAKTADDAQRAGINERMTAIKGEVAQLKARNEELRRFANEAQNISINVGVNSSLPELAQHLRDLQRAQQQALTGTEWQDYQKQIEQVSMQMDALKGKWKKGMTATFTVDTSAATEALRSIEGATIDDKTVTVTADTQQAFEQVQQLVAGIAGTTVTFKVKPMEVGMSIQSDAGLSAFINDMQAQLRSADFGTTLYDNLAETLRDTTALQAIVKTSLQDGIGTAFLEVADQSGKDFWTKAMEGSIEQTDWDSIIAQVNEKLKEMGKDPIVLDVNTGQVESKSKKMYESWGKAASAIREVGSAMQQIEDPAAKVMGTIAQAIATIALTFAQSLEKTFGPWDWVAAAAAGTATMITTIESIKSATKGGFAQGGIVPGNHFSGDMLNTQNYGINSGELVLTRAQQGNLASQLEGNALGDLMLDTSISAEDIQIVLNNRGKRTGRGEYVQSKKMR